MTPSGSDRLKASVRRLRRNTSPTFKPNPTSAFEVAAAERLKSLQRDVDQIRARLNWLFALIIGAAAANILLSLFE